jgi:germination protein M
MSKKSKKSKNNKKRVKRRYILSGTALALLLSVGIVALLVLHSAIEEVPPQPGQAEMVSVNFYFRDTEGNWGSEQRQLETEDDAADIINTVLRELFGGPQTAAFLPSIPNDVNIQGLRMRTAVENTLRIYFSPPFAYIDPIETIDIISSMVYTLTDLEFIDQIEFFIGDRPMLDSDGEERGFLSRDNIALTVISPIAVLTETFILYFTDEQMTGLVAEERTIEIERAIAQIPLEDTVRFILDALIEGPRYPGLYAVIPEGTVFTVGEHIGDTISVSFTQDFYDYLSSGGSTMEDMIVFSLVNTLTELTQIRRVHIFIDGGTIQHDYYGNLHIDLSSAIPRDESLILGDSEE